MPGVVAAVATQRCDLACYRRRVAMWESGKFYPGQSKKGVLLLL